MRRGAVVVMGLSVLVLTTGTMVSPAGAAPARRAAARANFVSACPYSHSAPDDPIVHPAVPGASHVHDFFANTTTGAGSTEESLQAGGTTCRRVLDTAAYWTPALYDGGRVIRPRAVLAYYQTNGRDPATIKPFPAGLRVVAGPGPGVAEWACATNGAPSMTGAPTCRPGEDLIVRIFFPDCWDGVNLDSADHRSHMAYSTRGACPASHPVAVPRLRLGFHYPGTNGGSDVTLSSGGPETAHADFFNAWNQVELERLVKTCLNAAVQCGPGR